MADYSSTHSLLPEVAEMAEISPELISPDFSTARSSVTNLTFWNDSMMSTEIPMSENPEAFYSELFQSDLAMPQWKALLVISILGTIILTTVIGNVLVIISVFTYTPLKITPNFFIVSLAAADLTVSVCVLPFNVAYMVLGRWIFGSVLCKMWLTSDVLCCTASILNLCAIALDRYYALHDPIKHAQSRSVKDVLKKIFWVWMISCIICLPPLIGWNDWPDEWTAETPCMLTEERGYIIYSSMGSFFIPLAIICFVYFKIFQNTRARLRNRVKRSAPPELTRNSANGPAGKGASGANNNPAKRLTPASAAKHKNGHIGSNGGHVKRAAISLTAAEAGSTPAASASAGNSNNNNNGDRPNSNEYENKIQEQNQQEMEIIDVTTTLEQQPIQKSTVKVTIDENGATSSRLENFDLENKKDPNSAPTEALTTPVNAAACANHQQLCKDGSMRRHILAKVKLKHKKMYQKSKNGSSSHLPKDEGESGPNQDQSKDFLEHRSVSLTPMTARGITAAASSGMGDATNNGQTCSNNSKGHTTKCKNSNNKSNTRPDSASHHSHHSGGHAKTTADKGTQLKKSHLQPQAQQQTQQKDVYAYINEKAKINLVKERKAARTMTIIVSTFIVCWLPFFLMYVIMPFCPSCGVNETVFHFITWLGYANSTLNPIIYTIFNVDFRVAFSRIMTGKAFLKR